MALLTIESSAFQAGGRIPRKHSGDGEDISPPLSWKGIPEKTQELALIVDDPDAPTPQPWVHWLLYRIPSTTTSLPEKIAPSLHATSPAGALQGKNSWSKIGYGGPAPPKGHGVHRYFFKLYALDARLALSAGIDKQTLLEAMQGHILAEGELVGTYER
jgi:Raf kinase inhibitor-like YbhB/YbcL family protein